MDWLLWRVLRCACRMVLWPSDLSPQQVGNYEAVLELTFYDRTRKANFVIERKLRGVAEEPISDPVSDWADDHASLSTDEEEELPDGDGTGISVSGEDGVNFGIVERKRRNGPFATPSSPLTINLAEGFEVVTFVKAKIRSLDGNDSGHRSFIATFEGDSPTIRPGSESTVQIIFNPKFEGQFDAALELIFSHGSLEDHKRFEFLDNETYIRRTGTGRQVPPQRVIPLWPSDRPRNSRKLPEYELLPLVQTAMENVTPKHPYDEEAPRLVEALRPGALNMDTYAQYFKALSNVEDAHQQYVASTRPVNREGYFKIISQMRWPGLRILVKYVGVDHATKFARVRQEFETQNALTTDNTILFVDPEQVSQDVRAQLGQEVQLRPYDTFIPYLKELGADLQAIKNATEIEGFRASHIRDGSALIRYFAWLEEQLNQGVKLSESQGADQLEKFRSELLLFKGLSFTTISSTGPNGDEQRRAFTRVLQGHIAIDTAIFPNGTSDANEAGSRTNSVTRGRGGTCGGTVLDNLNRPDYKHGIGHGVGHFLNVRKESEPELHAIEAGYDGFEWYGFPIPSPVLRPGFTKRVQNYADGEHGIRIENIVIVCEAQTPNNFGDKGFLGFEHVTMVPMGRNLIDVLLLSADERGWVDAYHKEVWEKVSPLLEGDARARAWLHRECAPL
ncbi:hypothetical protein EDB86DRAFT_2827843 [Lactarius hatsudake]|nr:hypothetical protein EDB86DRAFT_2827843 [Lactarius hatsudake]